jgi:hypothetical protein
MSKKPYASNYEDDWDREELRLKEKERHLARTFARVRKQRRPDEEE